MHCAATANPQVSRAAVRFLRRQPLGACAVIQLGVPVRKLAAQQMLCPPQHTVTPTCTGECLGQAQLSLCPRRRQRGILDQKPWSSAPAASAWRCAFLGGPLAVGKPSVCDCAWAEGRAGGRFGDEVEHTCCEAQPGSPTGQAKDSTLKSVCVQRMKAEGGRRVPPRRAGLELL